MSQFLSKRFENIEPYVPGEQPQDMEYIKLNTNESPYPPSPLVGEVLSGEQSNLKLYPDPNIKSLVDAISSYYQVDSKQVFVGNGSDEVLAMIFMAFCDQEKQICWPDISYSFYRVYAKLYGLKQNVIPVQDDFSINIKDYCGCGKNIVIANPNAPTGLCLSLNEIEKILQSNRDHLVIIDEAYVDFGGQSSIPLLDKYDNLIVVQTFSKSRSLAGARLGFAISSKEIIEDLNKIKFSFNSYTINRLSMKIGVATIKDVEYFIQCTQAIIGTRDATKKQLENLGFSVTDSKTNFLFAKPPGISGQDYYQNLKQNGILVRHFNTNKISDYVRITIGTPEQMKALINASKNIIKEV